MRSARRHARRSQVAVEPQQVRPRGDVAASTLWAPAGNHTVSHPPPAKLAVHHRRAFPRQPTPEPNPPPSCDPSAPSESPPPRPTGSSFRSGGSSEFSKYERHPLRSWPPPVHQLEQLRSGLLLGGVNILVSIDDIQIDSQFLAMRRQRPVPLGNRLVALRPQIPNRRRIFDQEGEAVRVEQRQHARGVGADGVPHAGVEAVIHMRQAPGRDAASAAHAFQLRHPLFLRSGAPDRCGNRGTACAKLRPCGAEKLDRVETRLRAESARTSSFMGVKRDGFPMPSSDSKYSSARLMPSQSKRADQLTHARRDRAEAVAIGLGS